MLSNLNELLVFPSFFGERTLFSGSESIFRRWTCSPDCRDFASASTPIHPSHQALIARIPLFVCCFFTYSYVN